MPCARASSTRSGNRASAAIGLPVPRSASGCGLAIAMTICGFGPLRRRCASSAKLNFALLAFGFGVLGEAVGIAVVRHQQDVDVPARALVDGAVQRIGARAC